MKRCKPDIRTALLLTGNEILSGDIVDTNSTYIARKFLPAGIKIDRKLVIGDDLQAIIQTLESLSEAFDIVIVNGGLGSTVDDLTAEAVSILIKKPLVENAAAVDNIKKLYGRSFKSDNAKYFTHLKKQAMLPDGVEVVPNPVGLAVGFKVQINRGTFYFTPGVPREMKTMLEETILPDLIANFPVNPSLITKKLKVIGTGESRIQQLINQQLPEDVWDQIELGFRASTAIVEVKLSIKDESAAESLQQVENKIKSLFKDQIAGEGESLQEVIIKLLASQNATLSVMESCSAGSISAKLNSYSDSNEVLTSGFYYKKFSELEKFLDVHIQPESHSQLIPIEQHERLVGSYLKKSGADYIIATSPAELIEKEVAGRPGKKLIVTCGSIDRLVSREYLIAREYEDFLIFVGVAALDLFRRFLQNFNFDNPYYFDELTRSQLK